MNRLMSGADKRANPENPESLLSRIPMLPKSMEAGEQGCALREERGGFLSSLSMVAVYNLSGAEMGGWRFVTLSLTLFGGL